MSGYGNERRVRVFSIPAAPSPDPQGLLPERLPACWPPSPLLALEDIAKCQPSSDSQLYTCGAPPYLTSLVWISGPTNSLGANQTGLFTALVLAGSLPAALGVVSIRKGFPFRTASPRPAPTPPSPRSFPGPLQLLMPVLNCDYLVTLSSGLC